MKWSVLVLAGGVLLVSTASRSAEDWRDQLALQLQQEHGCEVVLFSRVTERSIGDRHVVSARVHCADQRRYDAKRERPLERFQIRRCENAETC